MAFGRRRHESYNDPYYDSHNDRRGIGHGVRFFGPIRIRIFGINFYCSSGRTVGFLAGFFALFIMAISIFGMFSGYKQNKAEIEKYEQLIAVYNKQKEDYTTTKNGLGEKFNFYQEIIDKAYEIEDDGYYLTTGFFYDNFRNAIQDNGYNYQYGFENKINKVVDDAYEVEFVIDILYPSGEDLPETLQEKLIGGAGSSMMHFTTYAMYSSIVLENKLNSEYEIVDYPSYDKVYFEVAVAEIEGEVYSINTDFNKDLALTNETKYYNEKIDFCDELILDVNEEITETKAKLKTNKVGIGILFGIVGLIVLIIILSIVKVIKKSIKQQKIEDAKAEAEVQEAQAKAQEAQTRAEIVQDQRDRKNRYCEYCGAQIGENDTKCPNCGSVMFEVKK
ncbi:MAG: hypothetical protein IJX17_05850 [Clostridia bacterium]|nr:hypothetical protein [Clostridia bacterium]